MKSFQCFLGDKEENVFRGGTVIIIVIKFYINQLELMIRMHL